MEPLDVFSSQANSLAASIRHTLTFSVLQTLNEVRVPRQPDQNVDVKLLCLVALNPQGPSLNDAVNTPRTIWSMFLAVPSQDIPNKWCVCMGIYIDGELHGGIEKGQGGVKGGQRWFTCVCVCVCVLALIKICR